MFDEEHLCSEFTNLFTAGLEATAHYTTMLIYYLDLYPEVK